MPVDQCVTAAPTGGSMGSRALTTTRFGVITADADQLFDCPEGIPGFDDLGGLAVLPIDENTFFFWLQSTARPEVAFLAVDPWVFFGDYAIDIPESDCAALGLVDQDDAVVFCLTRPDRSRRLFHVNLLAPLLCSLRTRTARQVTLDGDYPLDRQLHIPDPACSPRPVGDGAVAAPPRVAVTAAAIGVELHP